MIDGKSVLAGTAIGTLETISDQDIALGKRNTGPVNRPDQFDQPHYDGNFQLYSAGAANGLRRISDYFHLSFRKQTKSSPPVNQV
jgi:hypothetical protein